MAGAVTRLALLGSVARRVGSTPELPTQLNSVGHSVAAVQSGLVWSGPMPDRKKIGPVQDQTGV